MKLYLVLFLAYFSSTTFAYSESNQWIIQLDADKRTKSIPSVRFSKNLSDLGPRFSNAQSKSIKQSPLKNLWLADATKAQIDSLLKSKSIVAAELDQKYDLYARNFVNRPTPRPLPQPVLPNDSLYSQQWFYRNANFDLAWTHFPQLQNITNRVLIFIVDTWVDADHPDFKRSNFLTTQMRPQEITQFHGTHVAGLISSWTNNFQGVAGGISDASIIPIEVCDITGCNLSSIIQSMYYVADSFPERNVPRVVNMSLGGGFYSRLMHQAVKYAQSKDVLIVAAAGNSSAPALKYYPASYPDVISVGASNENNELAYFSNFGQNSLTILAPGTNILSTVPTGLTSLNGSYVPQTVQGPYSYLNGTSMASPLVAAAAALVRAHKPQLTQSSVRKMIEDSALRLQLSGYSGGTYKFLDVANALSLSSRVRTQMPRASNFTQEQAVLDMNQTCYKGDNPVEGCSNCIKVFGSVPLSQDNQRTRIRWMTFDHFMNVNPVPIHITEVTPGQNFQDNISYYLPECSGASCYFTQYYFLIGYIEDRDSSGEIRDLIPISYSNGSEQFDISRSRCI